MKKCNLKNFIIIFLAFIICMSTGKLISCAADHDRVVDDSFFDIDNELLDEIKMMTDGMSKDGETLTQNFVFLDNDNEPEITFNLGTSNVDAEVYPRSVDFNKDAVLLGFISYSKMNDIQVDVILDYSSSEGIIPCFETQSGSIKGVELTDPVGYEYSENGDCLLHLIMDRNTLSELSYYKNEAYNMYVLKPVSENEKMILNNLSVTIAEGGFSFFRIINDKNNYEVPVAAVGYSLCQSEGKRVEYQLSDNQVSVNSFGSEKSIDIREIFNNNYTVAANGSCSSKEAEEIPACLLNGSMVTVSGDTEAVKIDIMTIDIPEKEYRSLEDGSASSVYRDTYVFANDSKENRVHYRSGSLGMDFFMRVFGTDGAVLPDLSAIIKTEELLGGPFSETVLQQNMAVINVKNVRDSEYAGEMIFRSESSKLASDTSVREKRSVASPSDAFRKGELIGDSNSEETETATDPADIRDNSEVVVIEADTRESSESINYPEKFAKGIFYVFVKGNGAEFILNDQTALLSEAFLRKASYCALDCCDTVIAFFNEHGRLISLADGYSEDDIASYVLIPLAEETENGRADLDICEISFLYNDMLMTDGTYAEVVYYDDSSEVKEADMYVSAYIDADSYIDLQFTNNSGLKEFEVFAEAYNAEIDLTASGSYEVKCSSEPGTVVYINGSEDNAADDISEYEGEYITVIDTENEYVETQVESDTEDEEKNGFENNESGDNSEIHNGETAAENDVNVENTENADKTETADNTVENRINEKSDGAVDENGNDLNADINNTELKSDIEDHSNNNVESTNDTGDSIAENAEQVQVSVPDNNTEGDSSAAYSNEGVDCESVLPNEIIIEKNADDFTIEVGLEENSSEISDNVYGFDEISDNSFPEIDENSENTTFEQTIKDSVDIGPVLEPISETKVDLNVTIE